MEKKEKLKRQWEYFNANGIYTDEEVIQLDKKLVLNIGTLGCRFTNEQIQANREKYKREVSGEGEI